MDASSAAVVTLACYGCIAGPAIMLGSLLVLFALPIALTTPIHTRGAVRWGGRCTVCGYSLAGLGERAQCPECGREQAGRTVESSKNGFAVAPVRAGFCFATLVLVMPVVAFNFSRPVWELLYLIEWDRVPLAIRPASGGGSLLLALVVLPALSRLLGPWRVRGLGLTIAATAAGFWLAQPIGLLYDWQLGLVHPGGPGMALASAGGLVVGFIAARVITARRAMLKLGRIRRSRAERSNSSAVPPSPGSPPAARPTTP